MEFHPSGAHAGAGWFLVHLRIKSSSPDTSCHILGRRSASRLGGRQSCTRRVMRIIPVGASISQAWADRRGIAFRRPDRQGGVTSGLLNAVVAEELPGPGTVFLGVEWRFLKARRRRNHRPPLHRAAAGGRCRIAAASISRSHLPKEVICLEAHYCPLLAHCSPASRRAGCPPNSWGDAASRASARQAPSAGAPPAQPRQGGQRQAHQCQRCRLRRRNAGDREPADRYG